MALTDDLLLTILGGRIQAAEALRDDLSDALGIDPRLRVTVQVVAGDTRFSSVIDGDNVQVTDDATGETIIQGKSSLLKMAVEQAQGNG